MVRRLDRQSIAAEQITLLLRTALFRQEFALPGLNRLSELRLPFSARSACRAEALQRRRATRREKIRIMEDSRAESRRNPKPLKFSWLNFNGIASK
jgi:hypothetical protein